LEGVEAEYLNDDALGRALDAIYVYNPEALYGQLAAQAVKCLAIVQSRAHGYQTSIRPLSSFFTS
jgi:hypothetical protein